MPKFLKPKAKFKPQEMTPLIPKNQIGKTYMSIRKSQRANLRAKQYYAQDQDWGTTITDSLEYGEASSVNPPTAQSLLRATVKSHFKKRYKNFSKQRMRHLTKNIIHTRAPLLESILPLSLLNDSDSDAKNWTKMS